jgi:hypothetical protein
MSVNNTELANLAPIVLDDILDQINLTESAHATIYVAIGSAAHMTKVDEKGNWYIEPQYEQQFPIFLSSLKKLCPYEPIHIILIDPMLENPPFVVCNGKKEIADGWTKIENETVHKFYNDATNVHIYPVQSYISYLGGSTDELASDAMPFFSKLNNIAISRNWLVIVHDYSGFNIGTLGDFFDAILVGHCDHIIYGIDSRSSEGGCYIDLTKPSCDFVYDVSKSGITVFNPYNFPNPAELISKLNTIKSIANIDDETKKNYTIAYEQVKYFIETKRKFITCDVMTLARQIKKLIDGHDIDHCIILYNSKNIESKYSVGIKKFLDDKKYDNLLILIIDIIKHELIHHIYPLHLEKTIDVVDETVKNMLECNDCHKWSSFIVRLLDDYDKNIGFGLI